MQNDLFGDVPVVKKKKKEYWAVSTHVCKNCMGKLLTRRVSPTVNECMCSECGARSYGSITTMCWCGVSAGQYGAIFECVINPDPKPSLPNLILVQEKPVEIKPIDITPNRRVYCPESYE